MTTMVSRLLLLGLMVGLISCGPVLVQNQEELISYIQDEKNGLTIRKSVNGIDYKLSYTPVDYLIASELQNELQKDQVAALREKYSQNLYFNLSVSKGKRELLSNMSMGKSNFSRLSKMLSFEIGNAVQLYSSQRDTLQLIDFIYPKMYGMSQSTDVLFVFQKEDLPADGDLNFVLEDMGLGTGSIKFKFQNDKIINEPEFRL